jgi:hypothetical protein
MPAFLRASEPKLATVQRARKSKRVKAIHAKIPNRRKDFLHKETTKILPIGRDALLKEPMPEDRGLEATAFRRRSSHS